MSRKRMGVVVDGAYNTGLTVRLDPGFSTEDLRIGDFVTLEGQHNTYFSMISDIGLHSTSAGLVADPPQSISPFVAGVLSGVTAYATVQIRPMLMMARHDQGTFVEDLTPPETVRTIPMHFSVLSEASEMDFHAVFGREDASHFAVGTPLTMETPVCLDLERLVERSNGIFGQSGTGKSFLVRMLLCGIVKSGLAVNLIFDMHDEYAFGKQSEDGHWIKGLRHLFGSQVLIYSLDEAAAVRPGRNADATLKLGLNQLEPEDILLLAEELNLRATAEPTIGLLQDHYRERWLQKLLDMSPEELGGFCESGGAHPATMGALQRNLKRIARRPYVVKQTSFSMIDEMVAALERGHHVILHFGNHDSTLDHILVANVVTRRVRQLYRQKAERYEQTQSPADRPRSLVITIEEAHKFLNPRVSRQTIFGTIARELRKYHVILMVVDQRPGGIDGEVLSQLGTRITGKLTEERDIEAALTGVANRTFLKNALNSLSTREEMLITGHAVPMPIVLRTRRYDEDFYKAITTGRRAPEADEKHFEDLFGPRHN